MLDKLHYLITSAAGAGNILTILNLFIQVTGSDTKQSQLQFVSDLCLYIVNAKPCFLPPN